MLPLRLLRPLGLLRLRPCGRPPRLGQGHLAAGQAMRSTFATQCRARRALTRTRHFPVSPFLSGAGPSLLAGQGMALRRRRGTRRALRRCPLSGWAGFASLAGERLAACGAGQGVALRRRRGTRSALRRCPLGGWAGFSLLAGERLAACSAGQGVTLRRRRGTRRALRRCPLGGWAGFASLAGERLAACSAGQGVTLRRRRGTRRALRWLLLGANAGFASLARERRAAHTWQGMALR